MNKITHLKDIKSDLTKNTENGCEEYSHIPFRRSLIEINFTPPRLKIVSPLLGPEIGGIVRVFRNRGDRKKQYEVR